MSQRRIAEEDAGVDSGAGAAILSPAKVNKVSLWEEELLDGNVGVFGEVTALILELYCVRVRSEDLVLSGQCDHVVQADLGLHYVPSPSLYQGQKHNMKRNSYVPASRPCYAPQVIVRLNPPSASVCDLNLDLLPWSAISSAIVLRVFVQLAVQVLDLDLRFRFYLVVLRAEAVAASWRFCYHITGPDRASTKGTGLADIVLVPAVDKRRCSNPNAPGYRTKMNSASANRPACRDPLTEGQPPERERRWCTWLRL
jgi:hypothetical protein